MGVAIPHAESPRAGPEAQGSDRARCIHSNDPVLAATWIPLRAARALLRDRDRELRGSTVGAGGAHGNHRERRVGPSSTADQSPRVRARDPVPHSARGRSSAKPPSALPRGREHRPERAHRRGGKRGGHRPPPQGLVPRCDRQAHPGRRQDWNGRQSLRHVRARRETPIVSGRQPNGRVHLLYRRPVLRSRNSVRFRAQGGPVPVHERPAAPRLGASRPLARAAPRHAPTAIRAACLT